MVGAVAGPAVPPRRVTGIHCLTEAQLRRGLAAVIAGWDRCVVCGEDNDDPHDAQPHGFAAPDVLTVFLEAARDEKTEGLPDGQSPAS